MPRTPTSIQFRLSGSATVLISRAGSASWFEAALWVNVSPENRWAGTSKAGSGSCDAGGSVGLRAIQEGGTGLHDERSARDGPWVPVPGASARFVRFFAQPITSASHSLQLVEVEGSVHLPA